MSRTRILVALALALPAPLASAGPPAPALEVEHTHASGAFTFRTPAGWRVEASQANPNHLHAAGDGLAVRFLFEPRELGYDALHGMCMLERPGGALDRESSVRSYEYDYVGGLVAERRALDSAFLVQYDQPVHGHREWRQRNVTVVGDGQSLCVVAWAPSRAWRKSKPTRALLEAVLGSLKFAKP